MQDILPGLSHAPNVHPIFVHFPIAFWLGAALLCTLGSARKHDPSFVAGRWLLYMGTLSAALAVATGFWATETMGHDAPGHDLVHVHRNFMLVSSSMALVATATAFALRRRSSGGVRWSITALLLATAIVTILGADRGAELVFRYGLGTAGEAPSAYDDHGHEHGNGNSEDHDDARTPHHANETETTRKPAQSAESSPAPQGWSPRSSDGGAAGADRGSLSAKDQPHGHDHDHHH